MKNKTAKFLGLVAVTAMVAALTANGAAAQGGNPPAGASGRGQMRGQMSHQAGQPQSAFVDENGDGICDNLPAGGQPMQQGQRGGMGSGIAQGAFVDENGDGICDNLPADGQPMQRGPRGRWNR